MKTVIFRFNGGLFQSGEKDDFKPRCGAGFLLRELGKRQIEFLLFLENEELNLNRYLVNYNLNNYFRSENIVRSKDTAADKIDSNFYQKIIKQYGLEAEKCIVFENNISGIVAARKAGIGSIVVLVSAAERYRYLNLSGVDDVISNFHQFNRLLLRV